MGSLLDNRVAVIPLFSQARFGEAIQFEPQGCELSIWRRVLFNLLLLLHRGLLLPC
jgi:hypothetical protein